MKFYPNTFFLKVVSCLFILLGILRAYLLFRDEIPIFLCDAFAWGSCRFVHHDFTYIAVDIIAILVQLMVIALCFGFYFLAHYPSKKPILEVTPAGMDFGKGEIVFWEEIEKIVYKKWGCFITIHLIVKDKENKTIKSIISHRPDGSILYYDKRVYLWNISILSFSQKKKFLAYAEQFIPVEKL